MAGTILISENLGLAISTIEFDYLVEKIRNKLNILDMNLAALIYEPLDEGGMTFISVTELHQDGYLKFMQATYQAYETAKNEAVFPAYEKLWHKLLKMLEEKE